MHLVVMAEVVGRTQQGILDLLVQIARLFLIQPAERLQQQIVHARVDRFFFLAFQAQVGQPQVLRLHHAVAAGQQAVVDDVLQLADIAWPAVLDQLGLGFGAQLHRPVAQPLAVAADEVPGQWQDVPRPVAQRVQLQGHHVQPVVQVFAEMPGVDRLLQLHVGRRQHPHIDRDTLARAQAHHFTLLQHAQQLDLDRQRQVTDFVEEQRAAVSLFEPAGLGCQGTGKGTFFMAEQLGFDQRLGECAAVHRDERPVAPAAEVVDMPCDQLLARAGFANDQDAGLAGGDLLQVGEQRLRPGVFEDLCGRPDRGSQCR